MRAICGLFALLIMLGPIGMGMMLNVDSPHMGEDALLTTFEAPVPEDHGTRSEPSEGPAFVNLYFRTSNIMNTTATTGGVSISTPGSDISFSLQKELLNDYTIKNPSPGYPMVAKVTLGGTGDLTVTVRDNAGGTTVGSASLNGFSYGATPTDVEINIPFSSGTSYTFSKGNIIQIALDFTNTGRLYYNAETSQSRLQLYGTTVPDVSLETANFFDWATDDFYPNNINFPDERKKVIMSGTVNEVFGKTGAWQYVDLVEVQIVGPGYNETRTTSYDRTTFEYRYTWNYPYNQMWGEYTVRTIITDEQDNKFTIQGSFNMSQYGALMTAPSQFPEEGSFQAEARKNVVEGSITHYYIKLWNIGWSESGYNITTTGQSGWDWWLWGDNLTTNNSQTSSIDNIQPRAYRGFMLAVDSQSKPIGSKATILVTATSTEDPGQDRTLTTKSTVSLKYDVEMKFIENSLKTLTRKMETGDSASIGFTIKNNGVETDTINIDLSLVPAGWALSLKGEDLKGSQGNYYVTLAGGVTTSTKNPLTLTIATPSDRGDENVGIQITGTSQGSIDQQDDEPSSDKLTVNVETSSGLKFILNDLIEKDVDPEDTQRFDFRLENTGTKLANFTVSFSGLRSSDGWESGDASFDEFGYVPTLEFNNLAPSNPRDFTLYIEPSIEVFAKNYTIQIHVENREQPTTKFVNQLIFIIVNEEFRVEIVDPISLELYNEAEPGEDVEYTIIIENNGNVEERVTVSVDLPGGWELDFGNDSSDWIKDLSPGDEETIQLVLSVPDNAQGDETIEITISIIPAKSDVIQVVTHTKITQIWYQPLMTLIVPLLLFVVIIAMVIVIYKKR